MDAAQCEGCTGPDPCTSEKCPSKFPDQKQYVGCWSVKDRGVKNSETGLYKGVKFNGTFGWRKLMCKGVRAETCNLWAYVRDADVDIGLKGEFILAGNKRHSRKCAHYVGDRKKKTKKRYVLQSYIPAGIQNILVITH